jgi:hypothetical protein
VFVTKGRVVFVFVLLLTTFSVIVHLSLCVLIVKNIVSETIHLFEVTLF